MAEESESQIPVSANGSMDHGATSIASPALSKAGSENAFLARGSSQWLDTLPNEPHVDSFRNCDFAATPLGPTQDWGAALRMYTSMVFADGRGSCIYWGPQLVAIFNERFNVFLADIGPSTMGKSLKEAMPTVWDQFIPVFDQARRTGLSVDVNDILIYIDRQGFCEETFFIGQFIPIRGDSGEVEGFYNTTYENTQRVLQMRRRQVFDRLSTIAPQPAVDEVIKQIVDVLRQSPKDIPMAMLYSYDELATPGGMNLHFRGGIGILPGLNCAPASARLEADTTGIVPYFRRVQDTGKPLLLSQTDGSLQATKDLFDGVEWCGFGEAARDIIVVPLSSGRTLLGFYVQGLNPRRPYDETTELSIIDMTRQMETTWVSSISAEQARLREQNLERRATDSESRLKHMAQHAPFGMWQVTPDKKIRWANQQFYDITGHSARWSDAADYIDNILAEEDRADAHKALDRLLQGEDCPPKEIRLQRPWTPPGKRRNSQENEDYSAWVLELRFPLIEDGKVKLIMGYIIDISHQKWAESVQIHNAATAAEAKRRQEEFIDSTSHEMRNPLTAMTQLADGVARSLEDFKPRTSAEYLKIIEDNIDAANTILACAAHQKRVIDDVLILTRLESKMLGITPVVERPSRVVGNTIKMFAGEAAINNITIEAARDHSYDSLQIDYVLIDTSRLTQVLINLISNAIKFTGNANERKVSVVYGAQHRRPPQITTTFGKLDWLPTLEPQEKNRALPELKYGEDILYLYFCVQDTGTGMSAAEMKRLFKRFSQATTRTHITYGGSGIGLYICRQLAEKQGGGVGVAAKSNEGAVFAFYIETRAVHASEIEPEKQHPDTDLAPLITTNGQAGLPSLVATEFDLSRMDSLPRSTPPPSTSTPPTSARSQPPPRTYTILLVEDNLVNQKILAAQLRRAKSTVLIANHGLEALQILATTDCWSRSPSEDLFSNSDHRPHLDVILLDWEMPEMNGLECCKRIRELEKEGQITRKMSIIATTANVRKEQLDQAMQAGMDSVMTKPFTCAELLGKIEQTVNAAQQKNDLMGLE